MLAKPKDTKAYKLLTERVKAQNTEESKEVFKMQRFAAVQSKVTSNRLAK